MYSKLQYISQGESATEQLNNIQQALDAGCDWIQLRFKHAKENELLDAAEKVKLLCKKQGATFIINDNVQLAKQIDADGVHLGLSDESPIVARNILGNKIIGGTANTFQDVLKRIEEKCDYLGLGPFRFTSTKEKLSPILGTEGYSKIISESKNKNIFIPIYAIGGIVLEDLPELMNTGIYGIAVSGIITNHSDKKLLIGQLNHQLHANT